MRARERENERERELGREIEDEGGRMVSGFSELNRQLPHHIFISPSTSACPHGDRSLYLEQRSRETF